MRKYFLSITILLSSAFSLGISAFFYNGCSLKSKDTLITSFQLCPATTLDHVPYQFFSETLNLFTSSSVTLSSFNTKQAEKDLLNTHFFKNASVSLSIFGEPIITYSLRQPIAYSGDISNMAIDASGHFFPKASFISLKKVPLLFTGIPHSITTGQSLDPHVFIIFQDILSILSELAIEYVDFSLLFKEGFFQEIGIKTRSGDFLRVSPFNYEKELMGYLAIRSLPKLCKASVFDLRVPNIALILFND